jgi:hypothetical protein
MIIQIRGTSGSGKSTVMRQVMLTLGEWLPIRREGRKQPLGYQHADIVVLGHYESPCGGCDTIGSARAVYTLIQETDAPIILCEGLLLSEDVKWSSQLPDLRIIYLTTPLEQCITQIQQRRLAVGNSKPLNTDNTTHRVGVIERSRVKLGALGVCCRRCPPEQAVGIIIKWIGSVT